MTKQSLIILKQLVYAEIVAFKGIDNQFIQKYLDLLKKVYKDVEKELCR